MYTEINAFKRQGYNVIYCGYLEDGVAIFNNENKIIKKKKYLFSNEKIIHLLRRSMLMKCCREYIEENSIVFDFAYVRYHFFDKKFIKLLKELHLASKKVIIEAHSAPKFPKGLSVMSYIGFRDHIWNKKAKKYVDLVASMSNEESLWGVDTVKIANGIDISNISLHQYNGNCDDINLIAVSFESPVHGYDRVLKGIRNYYDGGGTRKIMFHIVGTTLNSTDNLIKKLNLEDICIKYGPKSGIELDRIYNNANIGIGCLANHRIGSFYGSALKTKEYIAKGIPFIYGWKEKVLENFMYAKCFELCEEPIDFNEVISFYDALPKNGLSQKIRNCLSEEDTWDYQIKKIINRL